MRSPSRSSSNSLQIREAILLQDLQVVVLQIQEAILLQGLQVVVLQVQEAILLLQGLQVVHLQEEAVVAQVLQDQTIIVLQAEVLQEEDKNIKTKTPRLHFLNFKRL
ncbi:MAG: hypothetical protein R2771_08665 [Saprospiraceae bacterium]